MTTINGYSAKSSAKRAGLAAGLDGATMLLTERDGRWFFAAPAAPKATLPLRAKDLIIMRLASRSKGVSGKEIATACGWTTGSARWDCLRIANKRGWLAVPVPGEVVRYRITDANGAAIRI
jgi:hypothetical protein